MDLGSHRPALNQDRWAVPAVRRSIVVGDYRVTYLPDGYVELHPTRWFSLAASNTELEQHSHLLGDTGHLTGSIGSLLVTGPGTAVLIDAGFGPRHLAAHQSHPALGAMYGGGLETADVPPLTAVCFTHLHEDHTGWLRALGTPTQQALAKAPKFASEAELVANGLLGQDGWLAANFGQQIAEGIEAIPSPGHTRGHTSYLISSRGESLLCFGDVMHSPVQVEQPYLNSCFEEDPAASLTSRHQLLERAAATGIATAGMHFADVVFGRVERTAASYQWVPIY